MKILCFLTRVLGNRTMSEATVAVLKKQEHIDFTYVYLDPSDYRLFPAPSYLRWSEGLEAAYVCRRKAASIEEDFDAVIINGVELAWAIRPFLKGRPFVLMLDALPIGKGRLSQTDMPLHRRLKNLVASIGLWSLYRRTIRTCSYFLPSSQWTATGLTNYFGVRTDQIGVARLGLDLSRWTPNRSNKETDSIRILFVGNAFIRKGGDILIDAFKKINRLNVYLTILSGDRHLDGMTLPARVTRIRHLPHDEVPDVFRGADLFVLPTRRDYNPYVVVEAMACGLPVIATDVAGVAEPIEEGENGYVLSLSDGAADLTRHIETLIDAPDKRRRFGERSRQIAEAKHSLTSFETAICKAVAILVKEHDSWSDSASRSQTGRRHN